MARKGERQRDVALRDVLAAKLTAPWRWLRKSGNSQFDIRNSFDLRPLTSDL